MGRDRALAVRGDGADRRVSLRSPGSHGQGPPCARAGQHPPAPAHVLPLLLSSWAVDAMVEADGFPRESTHVVGCGRNADIAPPPDRDWSSPRFLFVGNDWERKNGEGILHAFKQLRVACPAAKLDVVGGHPPSIWRASRRTDASTCTNEREKLDSSICSAAPLLRHAAWIEPLGIVYVEAAAAGIASIGTAVGGTATAIGDAGIRVDPADPTALVEAMTCLAEPDRARTLGQRALAQSEEQFTWRKVAERLVRASGLAPEGLEAAGRVPMTTPYLKGAVTARRSLHQSLPCPDAGPLPMLDDAQACHVSATSAGSWIASTHATPAAAGRIASGRPAHRARSLGGRCRRPVTSLGQSRW